MPRLLPLLLAGTFLVPTPLAKRSLLQTRRSNRHVTRTYHLHSREVDAQDTVQHPDTTSSAAAPTNSSSGPHPKPPHGGGHRASQEPGFQEPVTHLIVLQHGLGGAAADWYLARLRILTHDSGDAWASCRWNAALDAAGSPDPVGTTLQNAARSRFSGGVSGGGVSGEADSPAAGSPAASSSGEGGDHGGSEKSNDWFLDGRQERVRAVFFAPNVQDFETLGVQAAAQVVYEKVVQKMTDFLAQRRPVKYFSFVGHSFGGLVLRYLLVLLWERFSSQSGDMRPSSRVGTVGTPLVVDLDDHYQREGGPVFRNFFTAATPHLGVPRSRSKELQLESVSSAVAMYSETVLHMGGLWGSERQNLEDDHSLRNHPKQAVREVPCLLAVVRPFGPLHRRVHS